MSNLFESKSNEDIKEVGKDLMDFGTGYQPSKLVMAKDMTLRDYFAGQIVSQLIDKDDSMDVYSLKAFRAYALANAMIQERNA